MTPRARIARQQALAKMRMRVRATSVHRRITQGRGPEPGQNPARVAGLRLAAPHLAGATTIQLRGEVLIGRFIAGDRLAIDGQELVVAAETYAAEGLDTASVPVTAGLALPAAADAPVMVRWAADTTVHAALGRGQRAISDGQLQERRNETAIVAAAEFGAAGEPRGEDLLLLPDGSTLTVVSVLPDRVDGFPVLWSLQLR